MAVTLNALTTGVGGLQTTGDTSGAIQLQSNGTATLTVTAAGNVGIGTASPVNKLEVVSSGGLGVFTSTAAGQGSIKFVCSNVTTPGVGYVGINAFANNVFAIGTDASTAVPVTIYTNATEKFRIGTAGEIGLSGANYGTSGQFLTSNGPGAAASWTTAAAGGFSNMQVFASPGTFTTPSTTTKIKVTVVGGGGGGGAGAPGAGGGGGGGGAIYVGPVSASTPYAVTVGTGGASGASGNTSSFGALASATGGGGGIGGNGGAGSAGTLQVGGGAGQSFAPGGSGSGGPSLLGGGGNSGSAGRNYGGGGGGAPGSASAGAGGVVVVEY